MSDEIAKYKLKLRGGGSLVDCKPVFANDSTSSLLCGSGSQVKVFSNGECVRRLVGHDAKVTGIVLSSTNSLQALSSSLDGTIICWDWKYGGLLRRYKFDNPIFALYSSGNGELFGVIGTDNSNHSLVRFTLGKKPEDGVKTKVLIENVSSDPSHSAVGCEGELVASIHFRKLTVCNLKTGEKKEIPCHLSRMTCIDCHPKEHVIATGCFDGHIILWRNIFDPHLPLIKTTEHWHSLPVRSVAFSAEGSILLSGGYECVLVKWHLPDMKNRSKLPRLGAPIVNLACSSDSTNYAVCYIDNGVQVIDNMFCIKNTFQGLVQGHFELQMKQPMATGLHFDPRTGAIVLNGRPGHIQFFDVKKEEQIFTLDICGENYVSPDDLKKPLFLTEVENLAFDADGDWLATVERRDDGTTAVTAQLKFWSYSKESQTYTLNTSVRLPHYQRVSTLKFCQAAYPMAVTSCPDGKFKLWSLVDVNDAYGQRSYWKCDSMGTYHNKKPGSADFSDDGSLLAVAFEDLMTLWEPESLSLVDVFSVSTEDISNVTFGKGQNSEILMFSTKSSLFAWNVLLGHLQWTKSLGVQTIAANPKDGSVAVFSKNNLLVYNPSQNSQPTFTYDIDEREIISAAFNIYSSKSSVDTLYFITKQQELLSLTLDGSEEIEADVEAVTLEQKIPLSKLIITTQKKSAVAPVSAELKNAQSFIKEIVNMKVSFMPSMTDLCRNYLEKLTKSSNAFKQNSDEDSDDESDEEEIRQKTSASDESDIDEDMEANSDIQESDAEPMET